MQAMDADLQVRLKTDPKLLCAVRSLVRNYAILHGVEAERLDGVVLAVDEACTNAMRHSYGGSQQAEICLRLSAGTDWLEIELRDEGRPIPGEKLLPPDEAKVEAERLTPGGLGMFLIHRSFDEVRYEPGRSRGNRVLMRLRLTQSIGTQPCR